MSKFNTDKVREELESDKWSARELQSQLRQALNEIDRLKETIKDKDEYCTAILDLDKERVMVIEQRTKAAVEEALYDEIAYALGPGYWDKAKQAIKEA